MMRDAGLRVDATLAGLLPTLERDLLALACSKEG
jgi:hypothetical protein